MIYAQHEHVPSAEQEAAVDTLLERYGWQLLERDEYVRRTLDRLRAGSTADTTRAAMFVYSEALYAACSGNQGIQRRQLGYTELSRWLFNVAHARYRDVAEDATGQALLATFHDFDRCRLPGAFMLFALTQLRDAADRQHRSAGHNLRSDQEWRPTDELDNPGGTT